MSTYARRAMSLTVAVPSVRCWNSDERMPMFAVRAQLGRQGCTAPTRQPRRDLLAATDSHQRIQGHHQSRGARTTELGKPSDLAAIRLSRSPPDGGPHQDRDTTHNIRINHLELDHRGTTRVGKAP